MADRVKLQNFGDYLDLLNAQTSVQAVDERIGDWPGGNDRRGSLISYAKAHYGRDRMLCQWALWAEANGERAR
jgi:hypothetical protein